MIAPSLKFTEPDSIAANKQWKATCGPHSIAAALGITLEDVREAMIGADINYRGWMSPTQVSKTLDRLGTTYELTKGLKTPTLCNGINRVQWEGKWLNPGVPARVAYFHTHLVAHFDGWVLCTGCLPAKWIRENDWRSFYLETEPVSPFHITHHWELDRVPAHPVYVDAAVWPYGRMMMCHMFSEDLDALHAMADAIGIKRKWFQKRPGFPHYDICKSKRAEAVELGAVEVDRKEFVAIYKRIRAAGQEVGSHRRTNGGAKTEGGDPRGNQRKRDAANDGRTDDGRPRTASLRCRWGESLFEYRCAIAEGFRATRCLMCEAPTASPNRDERGGPNS